MSCILPLFSLSRTISNSLSPHILSCSLQTSMHAYKLDQTSRPCQHRIQHRHVCYLQKQSPNAQWLVFLDARWVPLDLVNFIKLEDTLLAGGTFVDIHDSHFPEIPKVRVFPGSGYISYLGAKYRLSKVLLP